MAIIVEEEGDIAAFKDYNPSAGPETPAASPPAPPAPAAAAAPVPAEAAAPTPVAGARVLASPLARVTAANAGIALAVMAGSGPGGRVIAADVAEAVASGGAPEPLPLVEVGLAGYTDLEVTKYKRVTAERLLESKRSVPHYYMTVDCGIDRMLALRKEVNERGDGEYKISVNDFVIKAAATALRRVPEVNSRWMGDVVRMYHSADISIAVQTERGLITPIVQEADRKGLRDISEDVKRLAGKARENALEPEEFMGGTFTISNLGMYGVSSFSAIVNPPQAAILAVGASEERVVVDKEAVSGFGTKTMLSVTLSCDHRVVDGAVGAQWLDVFRKCLEDPVNMIM